MGTASTTKYIKNVNGQLTEQAAITDSAGAADADRVPALGAGGFLDPTIVNATVTSAGAADADKIPQLGGDGRLDASVLPVGIGADVAIIEASEALAAGDEVNIWNDAGAFKVRKADATVAGKESQGFVLSAFALGTPATVYFEGTNTAKTGLTPGVQFLSTTAGQVQAAAPTGAGQVVQRVGFATSATAMNYQSGVPVVLA